MSIKTKRSGEKKANAVAEMQRQRQEYMLLETLDAAEDALHGGQIAASQRLLRQAISTLNEYAEHRVLLQKIERLGVDAPSTIRYIDEYRRRQGGTSA